MGIPTRVGNLCYAFAAAREGHSALGISRMRSARSLLAGGAWTLVTALVAASQTQPFRGVVRTADNDPVKREEVQIEGVSKYVTGDSGEFAFPPSPLLQVESEVTFHVTHWVVVYPCELRNGRTFLPPATRLIQLKVLRPRDPRLKSLASDLCILGCLLQEEASHFEPKRGQTGGPSGSLPNPKTPDWAEQKKPASTRGLEADEVGHSRVLQVAYVVRTGRNPYQRSMPQVASTARPNENRFLARKARELGFTNAELAAAINEWAKSVEDPYERGLAALHEFRYAEASRDISQSLTLAKGNITERYVPLARAEYEQGHYPAAESALRQALAVHRRDPIVLNLLALVLATQAKYADAEPYYKRALEVTREVNGPGNPDFAAILVNLAELCRAERRYSEAKPLYNQALKIQEKTLGAGDPDMATSLNGLGLLYYDQGDGVEAERLYKQALEIDKRNMASERPQDVAATLDNLAELYRAAELFSDAEPLYKQALDVILKGLGPDHPDVARVMNNWALLNHAQGNDAEAEKKYRQALSIEQKALPANHPFIAKTLDNLAELYRANNRYSQAEPLYKQALAIAKQTPDRLQMATYLGHLAVLYDAQRKYSQAEPLYHQALSIDEQGMRPDDPELAVALGNLGFVYKEEGKYNEAEPLLRRAWDIQSKALNPDDPALLATAQNLAATLMQLGRRREAKVYADQAARILLDLGAARAHEQGNDAEAEALFKRALESAENSLGREDSEVARELNNVAVADTALGKDADAEPLFRQALKIEEKTRGMQDPHVGEIAKNLAAVLRRMGRGAEAQVYEDLAAKAGAGSARQP